MTFANTFSRSAMAALGLALLAGASWLQAQTVEAPALGFLQTLRFAHQQNTPVPPAQAIRIYSSPANVTYTATATTATGGSWLLVNGLTQTTGNTGQNDLTVSVSPTVAPGTYSGTVTVASGSTSHNIDVQLTVSANPVARIDPASLVHMSIEAGTTRTVPLTISSSTTATPVQYSASVIAIDPPTGWLTPVPNIGTSGQPGSLVINASAIPAGRTSAVANVAFTANGIPVTVPVSINITPAAQIVAAPSTVTFPYQIGFQAPSPRSVTLTSSTQTALQYTASVTSNSPWLTLATASQAQGAMTVVGTTPNPIWLIPNIAAASTAVGTQEATVTVTASNGSTQTITARLVISNTNQLVVTQDAVPFSYTLGAQVPAAQTFNVTTTNQSSQTFTATPTYTSGGEWFTVVPTAGLTPSGVTVSISPTRLSQLTAGTYTGSVRVSGAGTNIDVPVTLTVSGTALITVEPMQPEPFQARQGETPTARTLIIRSTDGTNQSFTLATEYGTGASNWLVVSPAGGGSTSTTGAVLTLNVNPNAVTAPGTYEATLVITPTGMAQAPQVRIPIRYIVTGSASVTANPTRFDLTQVGSTVPAAQTITLTSNTGTNLSYVASADQPWIQLSQSTGTIPGPLSFSLMTSNLTPREAPYTANITIIVGGVQTLTIPVSVRVGSAAALQADKTTLTFTATQSLAAPAEQTVNLTSSGTPLTFTATASSTVSTANWLTVEPTSGTTPATLRVRVNHQGLAPGTYNGVIAINAPNATTATTNINVTLTVSAPAVPTGIVVTSGATGQSRGVSPGEIVTIKGRNLAPATGALANIVGGVVQSTLSDVRVTFNGIEAPLLYVGPSGDRQGDQINAIVPYGIGSLATANLVVEYRGVRSEPVQVRVLETNPGIFTANSTGGGQGSILNENNTVNTLNTPAALGSIIQIYATGEGAVAPAGVNGQVINTVADLRRPLAAVSVRINGQTAEVLYAGSAPTLVSGVLQVNVRVPASLNVTAPTSVPIEIQVGQNVSQPGVTVAVRP